MKAIKSQSQQDGADECDDDATAEIQHQRQRHDCSHQRKDASCSLDLGSPVSQHAHGIGGEEIHRPVIPDGRAIEIEERGERQRHDKRQCPVPRQQEQADQQSIQLEIDDSWAQALRARLNMPQSSQQ